MGIGPADGPLDTTFDPQTRLMAWGAIAERFMTSMGMGSRMLCRAGMGSRLNRLAEGCCPGGWQHHIFEEPPPSLGKHGPLAEGGSTMKKAMVDAK